MKKMRTFFIAACMVSLVFVVHIMLSPMLKRTLVPISLADDDEEEEEDEDDEDNEDNSATEYTTVYTKLPDTVVQTSKQVPRYDSDGDGMYDDEDPHPVINEFLIVKDDNLNGIDDRYEQ